MQVTCHSSSGVIAVPEKIQQENVVGTCSVISYTNTMPTLTTGVSNIAMPDGTLQMPGLQNLQPLNVMLELHLLQEVCDVNGQHQVDTNTTAAPIAYVVSMTVTDNSPQDAQKVQEVLHDSTNLFIQEPQRPSTPNPKDNYDAAVVMNKTIIAGNLCDSSPNEERKVKTEPDKNVCSAKRRNFPIQERVMVDVSKPNVPKNVHKIHLLELEKKEENLRKEEKTHNDTYCRDWVSKSINYKNVSLAQSDGSDIERTSLDGLDISSLNITSVSNRNKQEDTGSQQKFISQRHKCQITKLPMQRSTDITTL